MARWRSLESLYLTAQPILLNIVGLFAIAYIIRALGNQSYGEWTTATSLVLTFGVLTHLGMRPIFVRALAHDRSSAPHRLDEQLGLRGLLGAAAALLSVVACLVFGHSTTVLLCVLIAGGTLVITALNEALADVLDAFERYTAFATILLLGGLLLTALSVVVCALGGGPVALALSYVSGPAFNLVAMAILIRRQLFRFRPRLHWSRFRHLLREARLPARNVVLGSLQDRAESLLLPRIVGYGSFGFFSAGIIPATRLDAIPSGMTSFFYPKIVRAYRSGVQAALMPVGHFLTLLLILSLGAALGATFLAPWVGAILFRENAGPCTMVLRITMWSVPLVALNWGASCALQASGRFDENARAGIRAVYVNLAVTVVLVLGFGLVGAAVSVVSKAVVSLALLAPPFFRAFPGVLRRVPWARLVGAAAAMQVTFLLSARLPAGGLAIGAVGGSLAYLGVLALSGVISPNNLHAMLSGGMASVHHPTPVDLRREVPTESVAP
jgi:O-antigen/teichoic acid export membrane protein